MRHYRINSVGRAPGARRGIASVLAMLFLTLFSVLAVGFFATVTMSAQVSRNEQRVAEAQFAAESGMQWVRRQMIRFNVTPGTDPAASFTSLFAAVGAQLNGTTNMGGYNPTRGTDASGNDIIYIPGATGSGSSIVYHWMSLGGTGSTGGLARVTITRVGSDLYLKAVGTAAGASAAARAVQIEYVDTTVAWTPPGPGLLSKAPVTLSNGAIIAGGDVTVATAQSGVPSLTMSGGTSINQNFAYAAGGKAPSFSNGATVKGTVTANIPAPSFPQVDTTAFAAFVPAASAAQGPKVLTSTSTLTANQVFTNIRIKANANTSFGNSQVLNGVIYIESPNKVTFGGAVKVTGVIVTDNDRSKPLAGNTITIGNGVTVSGVEALNPANFASSENMATPKTMSGALIVAPNYKVTLNGGSQTYNDALVAEQFDISNGYRGTIAGTVLNLGDNAFTMVGGGQITFTAGGSSIPGLTGGQKYAIDLTSYAEVAP